MDIIFLYILQCCEEAGLWGGGTHPFLCDTSPNIMHCQIILNISDTTFSIFRLAVAHKPGLPSHHQSRAAAAAAARLFFTCQSYLNMRRRLDGKISLWEKAACLLSPLQPD